MLVRHPSQQSPDVADFPSLCLMKHTCLPSAVTGLSQNPYLWPSVPQASSHPRFVAMKPAWLHGGSTQTPEETGAGQGWCWSPLGGSSGSVRPEVPPSLIGGAGGCSRHVLGTDMSTAPGGPWAQNGAWPWPPTAGGSTERHCATSHQSLPHHPAATTPHASTRTSPLGNAGLGPEMPDVIQKPRCSVIYSYHSCSRCLSTEAELRGVCVSLSMHFSH